MIALAHIYIGSLLLRDLSLSLDATARGDWTETDYGVPRSPTLMELSNLEFENVEIDGYEIDLETLAAEGPQGKILAAAITAALTEYAEETDFLNWSIYDE